MKPMKLAVAMAVLALGSAQALAGTMDAKPMDNKAMEMDKDRTMTKAEAMRMFEAKVDAMMKQKGMVKLTPQDVQAIIDDIARKYGTAP